MSVPKQRRTKTRVRIRKYKDRLKKIGVSICSKCKKPVLPHHACSFCGNYNGKEIFKPREIKRKEKEEKKKKEEKEKNKK